MTDHDEWCREVDESLFSQDPDASRRPVDDVAEFLPPAATRPPRAVPTAAVDSALFGTGGDAGATEVQEPVVADVVAPADPEFELPGPEMYAAPAEPEFQLTEPDMHTAPAVAPLSFDEDDPGFVTPDSADDGGAPPPVPAARGRRRAWLVAGVAL